MPDEERNADILRVDVAVEELTMLSELFAVIRCKGDGGRGIQDSGGAQLAEQLADLVIKMAYLAGVEALEVANVHVGPAPLCALRAP